ncbi:uncharacterized protein DUF2637 [Streptomyces sp. Ag109_G2-6]|uniref:DUF2637 domain-containing protein n=1 Tax=Streptomyces TaxID=1883 RepID=UPI0009A4A9F9|nr:MULTISPECIES: DUF2637 domain-containing protein [Streptomyces]RPF41180.1 uncharacterized protein DUF2637 [Streptomyces sp. Ag109_G2-6]
MAAMQLTRTHRILVGVVVAGALVIAGIGFAGSYAAVRALALKKGFGSFSLVFPIGIDAGICVLLALDLLLTWIRIPFPLLRQTAWLLTAATIAFNGAAAWPDPLGVGMHAVIPVLFVVTVEAARHAVGRIADITADRHMEGVRITRWLLSPVPTFRLWRRMKLWELRSYEQAVGMEQDRLIYQARLQARFGRAWRRKAPVEALMPLRLARIGVPLAQTAPEGLAAAGIDPVLLPPAVVQAPAVAMGPAVGGPAVAMGTAVAGPAVAGPEAGAAPALPVAPGAGQGAAAAGPAPALAVAPQAAGGAGPTGPEGHAEPVEQVAHVAHLGPVEPEGPAVPEQWEGLDRAAARLGQAKLAQAPAPFAVAPEAMPAPHDSAWFAGPKAPQAAYEGGYNPQYVEGLEPTPVMPPAGPEEQQDPRTPAYDEADEAHDALDQEKFEEAAYEAYQAYVEAKNSHPTAHQLDQALAAAYGPLQPDSVSVIEAMMPTLKQRYQRDLESRFMQ